MSTRSKTNRPFNNLQLNELNIVSLLTHAQAHRELLRGPGPIKQHGGPDDVIIKFKAEKREIWGP